MKKMLIQAFVLSAAFGLSLTALAQSDASPGNSRTNPVVGTIQSIRGAVTLSRHGGAFAQIARQQPVMAGERLMVPPNGSVTIHYIEGCSQTFSRPGTYTIQPDCANDAGQPDDD